MYDKTRIRKLKLALLREGGDKRMDASDRISYLLHEYSDIMVPEQGTSKEDDLLRKSWLRYMVTKTYKYVKQDNKAVVIEAGGKTCDSVS